MGLEEKLKGYKKSVFAGQLIGGVPATYAAVSNADKIAKYIPGLEPIVNTENGLIAVGMGSNFVGDQIGTALSLLYFNWKNYKGISGKFRFIKDYANIAIRHLGSYVITYPLAYLTTKLVLATGLLTGVWAYTIPYLLESAITGLGYIASTMGYRRRTAFSHAT
ncbi:MAG: hypothetical protein Q8R04_07120 [Nanoarchaeota archaeon]|nr:hypothetical protein [Nanoarchaeota archaeon]